MGKRLWVERNKDGSWDAFSDDGAHIKFGKGKGQFSPGDLMKIALAGCADNSYINFSEQLVVDAVDAGLSDADADKLKERITRHIDKGCTVSRTYVHDTPVRLDVTVRH